MTVVQVMRGTIVYTRKMAVEPEAVYGMKQPGLEGRFMHVTDCTLCVTVVPFIPKGIEVVLISTLPHSELDVKPLTKLVQ